VSSQDIERIFRSFPYLSRLNLCTDIELYLFPLNGLDLLEQAAKTAIPLPSNLTVTVWQLEKNAQEAAQKNLQQKFSTLKVHFTSLPSLSPSLSSSSHIHPKCGMFKDHL
jgi:hypothetical protein